MLSWTDGTDWQLTVYEPDFKTPDWDRRTARCTKNLPRPLLRGQARQADAFADRIYREDEPGEPCFRPTEQQEGYLNMDYYGGDFCGHPAKAAVPARFRRQLHLPEPHL